MLCHALYNQKHYKETFYTFSQKHLNTFKVNTNCYAFFLFYYCQSLGECKSYKTAFLYGNYAYALSYLNNHTDNAIVLKKYFIEDFSITLNFSN